MWLWRYTLAGMPVRRVRVCLCRKFFCVSDLCFSTASEYVCVCVTARLPHRILDNLPAAATHITRDDSVVYSHGFPVGGKENDTENFFLYNHARMTIFYHTSAEYTGVRIVGFEVHPMR